MFFEFGKVCSHHVSEVVQECVRVEIFFGGILAREIVVLSAKVVGCMPVVLLEGVFEHFDFEYVLGGMVHKVDHDSPPVGSRVGVVLWQGWHLGYGQIEFELCHAHLLPSLFRLL